MTLAPISAPRFVPASAATQDDGRAVPWASLLQPDGEDPRSVKPDGATSACQAKLLQDSRTVSLVYPSLGSAREQGSRSLLPREQGSRSLLPREQASPYLLPEEQASPSLLPGCYLPPAPWYSAVVFGRWSAAPSADSPLRSGRGLSLGRAPLPLTPPSGDMAYWIPLPCPLSLAAPPSYVCGFVGLDLCRRPPSSISPQPPRHARSSSQMPPPPPPPPPPSLPRCRAAHAQAGPADGPIEVAPVRSK
ncbi:hypothetical protein CDD83_2325 [Cordyceps sp. RAO-2017]|nr:hypothetical protein CDD83_2325 [Cordyceps sp. RAO-2017]